MVNASGIDNASQATVGSQVLNSGSTTAVGFAHSLGDVDINQCMGSEQHTNIIFGSQKLIVNWLCLAEMYIATNRYDLAAMAFCNTEVVGEYPTEAACELDHNFTPKTPTTTELAELQQAYYARDEMLLRRITELEVQLNKPAPRPQVVQQRVVEQKALLPDATIQKLLASKYEEKEE